jgi:hypothetical protein
LEAEVHLEFAHPALVGLMVVAEEVEEAVEHEDGDFGFGVVAEVAGLGGGAVDGDGEVAEVAGGIRGWEGEDVGGLVEPAEVAVEAAEIVVGGDEDAEGAAARTRLRSRPLGVERNRMAPGCPGSADMVSAPFPRGWRREAGA